MREKERVPYNPKPIYSQDEIDFQKSSFPRCLCGRYYDSEKGDTFPGTIFPRCPDCKSKKDSAIEGKAEDVEIHLS